MLEHFFKNCRQNEVFHNFFLKSSKIAHFCASLFQRVLIFEDLERLVEAAEIWLFQKIVQCT